MTESGFVSFMGVKDLDPISKRVVRKAEKNLKEVKALLDDEFINGVVEEQGFGDDLLQVLRSLQANEMSNKVGNATVEVHSRALYDVVLDAVTSIV